jgi:acetyl esterase/lipase
MAISLLCLLQLTVALAGAERAQRPAPPEREYPHAGYARLMLGSGATGAVLLTPTEPKPDRAPVVYFTHGFMALSPDYYIGWIEHLTRSGYAVIFPNYQNLLLIGGMDFAGNAVAGIKRGLAALSDEVGIEHDTERVYAVGHSVGGMLAWWLGANAVEQGIPQPRVVFAVQPGGRPSVDAQKRPPADTFVVALYGEEDMTVRDTAARAMFAAATPDSPATRALVMLPSDRTGSPVLNANHFAPLSMPNPPILRRPSAGIDAHDYMMWAMFDGLIAAKEAGEQDIFHALKRPTPKWSDGRAVVPCHVLMGLTGDERRYPRATEMPTMGGARVTRNHRWSVSQSGIAPDEKVPLLLIGSCDNSPLEWKGSSSRATYGLRLRGANSVSMTLFGEFDPVQEEYPARAMESTGLGKRKFGAVICDGRSLERYHHFARTVGADLVVVLASGEPIEMFEPITGRLLVIGTEKGLRQNEAELQRLQDLQPVTLYETEATDNGALLEKLFTRGDDVAGVIMPWLMEGEWFPELADPWLRW